MFLAQKLAAPNDPNGNPQRLIAVYMAENDHAETVGMIEVGYGPYDSARQVAEHCGYAGAVALPTIEISRSDYHAAKRAAKAGDYYGTQR